MKKHAYIIFITMIVYRALSKKLFAGDNMRFHLLKPRRNNSGLKYLWKIEIEHTSKKDIPICLEGTVTEDKDSFFIREQTKNITVKPVRTKKQQ